MTGDGGTSEGDFYAAFNVASGWKLPVIFCIENNGYGISTPVKEQYAIENLVERGIGYGIESFMIEGNNVLEVYKNVSNIAGFSACSACEQLGITARLVFGILLQSRYIWSQG